MRSLCAACALCEHPGGEIVHRDDRLRIVLVEEANYPGFCRVIWNAHVGEMTDLSIDERASFMNAVWQVEAAVREAMRAHKINLASLGNLVPHLHWHVIPRFEDDAHFPAPIWTSAQRTPSPDRLAERTAQLPALRAAITARFDTRPHQRLDKLAAFPCPPPPSLSN